MSEYRNILMEEAISLFLNNNTDLTFEEFITQNKLIK